MAFAYKEGDRIATVETKIKLFEIMVLEKKLSEEREKLKKMMKRHRSMIDEAKVEYEERRKDYLKEIREKALADQKRIILQAEVEAKRQVLAKRKELLIRIQDDFIKKMEGLTNIEAYSAYFLKTFEAAAAEFGKKEELLIGVNPKDLGYIEEGYESRTDETIIGGFYLIHEGRVKYDYTLNRETEKMRDYLGEAVRALVQSIEGA